jgi:hypothetical protein
VGWARDEAARARARREFMVTDGEDLVEVPNEVKIERARVQAFIPIQPY